MKRRSLLRALPAAFALAHAGSRVNAQAASGPRAQANAGWSQGASQVRTVGVTASGRSDIAANTVAAAWQSFAARFVTAEGRVLDTGNASITHSEGVGTALLLAQAAGDRARFEQVFTFAQRLRRADGLFSWKWVAGQGVADANNASDGDLYIAWALLRAGVRWSEPEYRKTAREIAQALRERCLVQTEHGRLLSPSVEGFIERTGIGTARAVVNPSYWVWPALAELQWLESHPHWGEARENGLKLLAHARFGSHHLPADWLLLGDPVVPWPARPARFGFEAIRVPLFLAWAGKTDHPAFTACARYLQQPGFPAWVSLTNSQRAEYAAPNGFEAVARLVRRGAFGRPYSAPLLLEQDYYSSALTALATLAAHDVGWI
jgi:endoglucanase